MREALIQWDDTECRVPVRHRYKASEDRRLQIATFVTPYCPIVFSQVGQQEIGQFDLRLKEWFDANTYEAKKAVSRKPRKFLLTANEIARQRLEVNQDLYAQTGHHYLPTTYKQYECVTMTPSPMFAIDISACVDKTQQGRDIPHFLKSVADSPRHDQET